MDLARLAKIWKLTTSPNAGEAAAASDRARVIVEREGKVLADVPHLLRAKQRSNATKPAPGPEDSTVHDMGNPAHMAGSAQQDQVRRAKRAEKEAPERAEVLARYGSLKAVLAWTEKEQRLRNAVAKWSVPHGRPHQHWTKSIDGIELTTLKTIPPRIVRALSKAYPLPKTITAAAVEYAMWGKRDRDLGLAVEDTDNTQLDLPVHMRRAIVRQLLETQLHATSLDEVLVRQRHAVDSDRPDPEIEIAVLRDLEGLVAARDSQRAPKPKNTKPPRAAKTPGGPRPYEPDMFD